MTVMVSGDGAGVSSMVELPVGATVADLLAAVAPEVPSAAFRVSVNRRPAGTDHVLRSGDRVALTPTAQPAGG